MSTILVPKISSILVVTTHPPSFLSASPTAATISCYHADSAEQAYMYIQTPAKILATKVVHTARHDTRTTFWFVDTHNTLSQSM